MSNRFFVECRNIALVGTLTMAIGTSPKHLFRSWQKISSNKFEIITRDDSTMLELSTIIINKVPEVRFTF